MDGCTGGRKELRRQLEENPDWESDLLALYGFDIWDAIDGRVPVRRALQLIERLGHEPKSIWRAKTFGGSELKDYQKFIGWDANTYAIADLIDAVSYNTIVLMAVNASDDKNVPDFEPYPRPGVESTQAPVQTLDDFARGLAGMFGTNIA